MLPSQCLLIEDRPESTEASPDTLFGGTAQLLRE